MVSSKRRDIIERYRFLFEYNLVLTDELIHWFKIRRVLPEFILDELKTYSSTLERNRKFLNAILDNGDVAFTKFIEGLIANGQPFLGELIESEDKRAADVTTDPTERIVIDDDLLKKCPGVDKLRTDVREKMRIYLQEQLVKAYLRDTWKAQNQGKSVELINLKRQHYDTQQKLVENLDEEKRQVINLKDSLRGEQLVRQQREDEVKDLRTELNRLQSDFEYKWSSQIKMNDANNRSVFKMNDKIGMFTDWLRSLDILFKTNFLQSGIESDTVDQLQQKLRRYTLEIETLKERGIGTDQLREELYESISTSRFLPIEDRKNKTFYDLLVRLYGANQVQELATICTKDVLQTRLERDHANEIRLRDIKIEELNQLNRSLQAEIDRLKAMATETTATIVTPKPNPIVKPQWRPVPSSVTVTPKDKGKTRQTLKPISVQFGTKPGGT